jgi:hypothetical protein
LARGRGDRRTTGFSPVDLDDEPQLRALTALDRDGSRIQTPRSVPADQARRGSVPRTKCDTGAELNLTSQVTALRERDEMFDS